MVWPYLIPVAAVVGRKIASRPLLSAAGALIGYEILDNSENDENYIGFIPKDQFYQFVEDTTEAGGPFGGEIAGSIAQGISEAIPKAVEQIGPAIVLGVNNTVDAIKTELSGNEIKVIATVLGFTVVFTSMIFIVARVRAAGMSG